MARENLEVRRLTHRRDSLEEIFLKAVGHIARTPQRPRPKVEGGDRRWPSISAGISATRGPLTSPWTRLLVLPRFAWERLMQQRLVVILLVVALFWPLACGVFVYLSNQPSCYWV